MKEKLGDYYLIAGDDEPEERPIGIWGCGCPADTSAKGRSTDRAGRRDQRHLWYLKKHHRTAYAELLPPTADRAATISTTPPCSEKNGKYRAF